MVFHDPLSYFVVSVLLLDDPNAYPIVASWFHPSTKTPQLLQPMISRHRSISKTTKERLVIYSAEILYTQFQCRRLGAMDGVEKGVSFPYSNKLTMKTETIELVIFTRRRRNANISFIHSSCYEASHHATAAANGNGRVIFSERPGRAKK